MTDRRIEILTLLLTHYNDVEDALRGPSGVKGDGGAGPSMSQEWNHRSYQELERCLKLMRNEAPWLWWDVRERFLNYQTCRIRVPVTRSAKGPRPQLPPNTEEIAPVELDTKHGVYLVRRWAEHVNPANVTAGLEWISTEFHGEPFLPDAFLEAA